MSTQNSEFENSFMEREERRKRKYLVAAIIAFLALAAVTLYGVGQMVVM